MKAKKANFLVALWLKGWGYKGITLPPFGVYILKEDMDDQELVRHELIHWDQYKRMGLIKFYTTYFYYSVRYGYKKNPMEIEAREKSK